MPSVLHLLKSPEASLALAMIDQQRREPGTSVTVVLLAGAEASRLPDGVSVKRAGHDLTPSELLDLIFASDQVVAW